MFKISAALIGLSAIIVPVAAVAGQTPLVSIGENQRTSWTEAMESGRLRAIDPAVDGTPQPAMEFYAGEGNTAFVASALTPDLMTTLGSVPRGGEEETHLSLVMQWNPLMEGEDIAAASWEYDTRDIQRAGGLDLRTGTIHFSLGAPPGVWDVGVMLMDKQGLWAGWFMSMPPIGWSQQWIDTSLGDQDAWRYFADPGFDISNIFAIRLNEAGAMVTFPAPPAGAQPDYWDWNAFDHLTIVPAPGSMLLAAASVLLVGRRRRS